MSAPIDDGRTPRERGMDKMQEVYGFTYDPADVEGPFVDVTVDHLFGEIWTREGLDVRERRMLTIGALGALGLGNLLEIQFTSALANGEFTEDQIREIVLHLTHYVGWPLATSMNAAAEKVIAQRREDPR
ncbi:MAG: carboxymuconolactone decarboxylase family protein [Actinomycetes bacterium]